MIDNNTRYALVPQAESNEVPMLGPSVPMDVEKEFVSPLERLITQSTAEQRGDDFNIVTQWDDRENTAVNNNPIAGMIHYNNCTNNNNTNVRRSMEAQLPSSPSFSTSSKPSFVTLMACICWLLQVFFLWASFLSSSWLDTRLIISIAFPSLQVDSDKNAGNNGQLLLHSTTLGSLLSGLLASERHWAVIALVSTSIILPCLCAVLGVTAIIGIVGDRKEQNMIMQAGFNNKNIHNTRNLIRRLKRNQNNYPKIIIECIARIGFSVIFILCILVIGTSSSIKIQFNDTRFVSISQIQGGMVAYTLSMVCTLLVMTLLRLDRSNSYLMLDAIISTITDEQYVRPRPMKRKRRSSQDFQYSWQVSSNELFVGTHAENDIIIDKEDNMELQTPFLLSNGYNNRGSDLRDDKCTSNFLFISGTVKDDYLNYLTSTTPKYNTSVPIWKRVMIYELALLSVLLWLPTLFLPLFQVQYDGIISDFMSDISLSVRLWDFPSLFWEHCILTGTNRGMLIIVESALLLLVIICPIFATLLAILVWISDSPTRIYCKNLLWMIQPFLGSIVFSISLYFSLPAFEAVVEYVINTYSYGLCTQIEMVTTDTCLAIHGKPSMGLWFLFLQSLVLEIFVLVTISW
mmetsp:Transcript_45531/g.49187  ORF Transcript_45531/g.49187 Transcript_45531/m.49187 type:complete len:630 (+) Transcript_45531:127-2016(+)